MSTDARLRSSLLVLLALGLFFAGSPRAAGQPVGPAAAPAVVAKARAALQAGRATEALALADQVLATRPADTDALGVKVDALIGLNARDKALDAYDAWFGNARREEPGVLARLARADLKAVAALDGDPLQNRALGVLAGDDDAGARKRLEQLAWVEPPTVRSWPAIVELGGLGDARAINRIIRAVRESTGSGKVQALRALATVKTASADAALREALTGTDAFVQAAAADAAATLGRTALAPELTKLVQQGDPSARFSAAVALGRLGQPGGESLIEAGLTSRAPDARVRAAAVLRARGVRSWPEHLRPLLEDMNGLTRFQAAELLLEVDRQAPLTLLIAGTTDPNVAIRLEVARILAADPAIELAEFRRLLRDGAASVRVIAAGAILERQ